VAYERVKPTYIVKWNDKEFEKALIHARKIAGALSISAVLD